MFKDNNNTYPETSLSRKINFFVCIFFGNYFSPTTIRITAIKIEI